MAKVCALAALSGVIYNFEAAIKDNIEFVYISTETFRNQYNSLNKLKPHDYIIIRYTPEKHRRVAYIFMVMSDGEYFSTSKLPDYDYWNDKNKANDACSGEFLKTRFIEQCDPQRYCNWPDGPIFTVTEEGLKKFKQDFNVL